MADRPPARYLFPANQTNQPNQLIYQQEQRLVRELTQACQRRPGLRVRVLLDYSRARRGGPGRDSLATLAPLLAACPRQAEVSRGGPSVGV